LLFFRQYHDLGLIYFHMNRFCRGAMTVQMSPVSFIVNPVLWLTAASK